MERRYLLGLFELSMIFQDLRNMVFCAVKTMTLPNVTILVKSVWNKDKDNYQYNILLEKAYYKLPKGQAFVLIIDYTNGK